MQSAAGFLKMLPHWRYWTTLQPFKGVCIFTNSIAPIRPATVLPVFWPIPACKQGIRRQLKKLSESSPDKMTVCLPVFVGKKNK